MAPHSRRRAPLKVTKLTRPSLLFVLAGLCCIFLWSNALQGSGTPHLKAPKQPISLQGDGSISHSDHRSCNSSVDWSVRPRDPQKGWAAVFTPYNIVFGGGERYLLSVVQVFQRMGHEVDVLVLPENECKTKESLLEVASGLRINLDPTRIRLTVTLLNHTDSGTVIQAPQSLYSVFMLLGNEKYPQWPGLGHVNFYMCQFPFDLDRPTSDADNRATSTYDYILLNSEFSYKWFSKYMDLVFEKTQAAHGMIPSVEILHPPVEPYTDKTKAADSSTVRKDIVLLGRFFSGRQSKGHAAAIDIFKKILPDLPEGAGLHLIGGLMPGHNAYLEMLGKRAANLPVFFHVRASSSRIMQVLQGSLVQWHLTGIDQQSYDDPASEEHFGISIAEGMGAGTLPVVLNRGGVTDIVEHGQTGFLADDAEAIASFTRLAFSQSSADSAAMRAKAIDHVKQFSGQAFAAKLERLVHRGKLTKPLQHLIWSTSDVVLSRTFSLPKESEFAAVIIEPRQHYAFEYIVKNTMYHLGPTWTLYIFHGLANQEFVRRKLKHLPNVKFRLLEHHIVPIPALNRLLKSPDFWKEIDAKQVLFFQTDSLLLHGRIQPFLKYDYVGAPWHLENERWQFMHQSMPNGVGNGGLSLRSVDGMVRLSTAYGSKSPDTEQEDFLYAGHMERIPGYALAPRGAAYKFAVETPCPDLEQSSLNNTQLRTLEHVPFALHASWYYFDSGDRFKDLLTMLSASVCGA